MNNEDIEKDEIQDLVHQVEEKAGEIVLDAYTSAFTEFGKISLNGEDEALINEEAEGLQRQIANFMLRVVLNGK